MGKYQYLSTEQKKIGRNLNKAEREISRIIAESLVKLSEDLLQEANDGCPYETGDLRNSARAVLHRGKSRDIAEIKHIGGASPSGGGTVFGVGYTPSVSSYIWVLEIGYKRRSPSGIDLATYLHENLQPEGSAGKARQPGTGPKWLTNAAHRTVPFWVSGLDDEIRNGIETIRFDK